MTHPAFSEYRPTPVPGAWRGTSVLLLVALAGAHLAPLREWHTRAAYLDSGLATVAAAALGSAGALTVRGSRRDWQRAAAVAATASAAYVVSRGLGLPGATAVIGRWTSPYAAVALATDVLALAAIGAVLRLSGSGGSGGSGGAAGTGVRTRPPDPATAPSCPNAPLDSSRKDPR